MAGPVILEAVQISDVQGGMGVAKALEMGHFVIGRRSSVSGPWKYLYHSLPLIPPLQKPPDEGTESREKKGLPKG